jgi:hypothetical protein
LNSYDYTHEYNTQWYNTSKYINPGGKTMKFYNRRKELDFFQKVKGMDRKYFVVVFGRRRIGKTTKARSQRRREGRGDEKTRKQGR